MRLCQITPSLDIVITETSHVSRADSSGMIPLFRGYPGLTVRMCRLLLRWAAKRSMATPLAAMALRLCRRELTEMLLACDPDVVETAGVRWGSHLRRLLQPRFPQWFDESAAGGGPVPGWKSLDTSAPVSIVLPVFNVRRYLRQSIESCLNQTYPNIELLVVDDGSTDDLGSAVHAYRDSRLRLLRHDRNRGVAEALNTGFRVANGEYLTWTSDDNYYAGNAIEQMVRFLQTYPDVDFVYAEMHVVDERVGARSPRVWGIKPPEWLQARESNPIGACFLYRRRVYEALGEYDPTAFLVEDYDYWLRVSKYFHMQRFFRPLYYYRYHDDALTARYARSDVLAKRRQVRRLHGVRT